MEKPSVLKFYDDDRIFRAVLYKEGDAEKELYVSESSLVQLLNKFSKILKVEDFLSILEYGDELFYPFNIDTDQTDFLNVSHLVTQLEKAYTESLNDLENQQLSETIKKELKDNLASDLAASVFDALVYQMLAFAVGLASELNIEKITFSSRLMDIPRFKKLTAKEIEKSGLTLV